MYICEEVILKNSYKRKKRKNEMNIVNNALKIQTKVISLFCLERLYWLYRSCEYDI